MEPQRKSNFVHFSLNRSSNGIKFTILLESIDHSVSKIWLNWGGANHDLGGCTPRPQHGTGTAGCWGSLASEVIIET